MRKKLKLILLNPLLSGSVIMIFGSNASSFINYIYHFLMGRLLGPASYGELAVLLSFLGLVGMIPGSLNLVVIKYISSVKSASKIKTLIQWINKKLFFVGVFLFILIAFTSNQLASFMNIKNSFTVILVSVIFIFAMPSGFNRAILQGLLRFKAMVLGVTLENSAKLLFGITLVYLGFSVSGAVLGFVLSAIVGWILTLIFIKDYFNYSISERLNFKPLFLYAIPVVIQSIATTSIYSTDIVLVKHFFTAHDAGIYSALSSLGRIIVFGAGPIGGVMFPLVSKRQSEGRNYKIVFLYSLILTGLLSLSILLVYWLFPKLAINALFGSLYLEAENLLVWFGIFMSLFTLSTLIMSFHLSLGRSMVVILPLIAAVAQIIGIWLYHDSLLTVIKISILVTSILLVSLVLFSLIAQTDAKADIY